MVRLPTDAGHSERLLSFKRPSKRLSWAELQGPQHSLALAVQRMLLYSQASSVSDCGTPHAGYVASQLESFFGTWPHTLLNHRAKSQVMRHS